MEIKTTYRIEVIDEKTGEIEVRSLSTFSVAMRDKKFLDWRYTWQLPDAVHQNLAVLMTTDSKPPTVHIDGVGRRINTRTYWVEDTEHGEYG